MTKKIPTKEEIFGTKPKTEDENRFEKTPEDYLQKKWSGKGKIHDGLQPSRSETENLGLDCSIEPSRTDQSQKEDSDINTIMKRFETTGQLPHLIKTNPQYGDFSTPVDYQTALNTVMHAQDQFENLNAHIRARFENDPAQFLDFATNPDNLDEMVKLGLATKKPEDPLLGEMRGLRDDFKKGSKAAGDGGKGSEIEK